MSGRHNTGATTSVLPFPHPFPNLTHVRARLSGRLQRLTGLGLAVEPRVARALRGVDVADAVRHALHAVRAGRARRLERHARVAFLVEPRVALAQTAQRRLALRIQHALSEARARLLGRDG